MGNIATSNVTYHPRNVCVCGTNRPIFEVRSERWIDVRTLGGHHCHTEYSSGSPVSTIDPDCECLR